MARDTQLLFPDNSTDANFRAWIQLITGILTSAGFTKTSDTGQLNETTTTKPTTASQIVGYQIWRSNDGGSGLNNYYFKIEFGSSSISAATPLIWITFGWGSNGSGTLTGNLSTRTSLAPSSSGTTSQNYYCNAWGEAGTNFNFALWSNSSVYNIFINVERVRTIAGANSDVIFVWGLGASGFVNFTLPRTGTIPSAGANSQAGQRNIVAAQATYDSNTGLSTIAPIIGIAQMEAANIFGADTTNLTTLQSQHVFTVLGASRTYILNGVSWASGFRVLSRYDT